ncbi:hypothetical protein Q2T83_10440 [Fervidibacter sacchari]|uniref:Uncharacterized protein n=1 Tax=Candidatus Fervidibacter sacchari TaxID=1448929 RepID=A0ABT2EQN9_9BACT|nr:hypothetical protein [Candidatus Fervidibacter sacchari]MCS3920283.1 hypothetical protein [Candidatus Fervidibacter sacchari]WKU14752.1 hypothetical protein Q2T83_10440 [Candidatus Fervidibacter sacchari]
MTGDKGQGETETRRNGEAVNEEQKCQQIFTHHALRLYALRSMH